MIGPVEQPDQLGPAGSEQAGQSDHLARVDVQVERFDGALAAETLRRQVGATLHPLDGLPLRALLQRLQRGEVLADHLGDQLQSWQVGGQVFADQFTIAQNRDAVGNLIGLIEKVRDKEHGHPRVADLPDDGHQFGHLFHVQRRGGFVEHQHLGVDVDRAADGNQLLNGDRMGTEQ